MTLTLCSVQATPSSVTIPLARPPGGTQIARQSAERIQRNLLECNANHEGAFATSQQSDAILDEAHAAMADFLNAARPEEIIRNSYPWIEVGQRLLLSELRY